MRSTTPFTVLVAILALAALAACSSEPNRPARVTNYGARAPQPSAPQVASRPAPSGGAIAGPVRWYTRLADAQADARASGRLILALATKPRCGICKKFRNTIAPAAGGELQRVAVGYTFDITRPEVRAVDDVLRNHLRGASLMPLVGFLTPDLRWVNGFSGPRTVSQFRGDIATAGQSVSRSSAALDNVRTEQGAALGVINEFGESEWSPPADVWPVGPVARAGVAAEAPVVAEATPAPLPAMDLPASDVAAADVPVIADLPALPPAEAGFSGTAITSSQPAAEVAPTKANDLEVWGREALTKAREAIRAGRYGEASETLGTVHDRLPGTVVAREASKGGVALYNAKRIRLASTGAERERYLSRARRDLGTSMWGTLFGS